MSNGGTLRGFYLIHIHIFHVRKMQSGGEVMDVFASHAFFKETLGNEPRHIAFSGSCHAMEAEHKSLFWVGSTDVGAECSNHAGFDEVLAKEVLVKHF